MSDSANQYSSPPVERVQQRGKDGASNTLTSSKLSGEATNGGFSNVAPYEQPDSYTSMWSSKAKRS